MSAAKEAKARRSRLKRPSKAKPSLLKQVLVKNCFGKTQRALPPKDPHLKTETERAFESIFGSTLQPSWPKKSLETIFAAPFQPVEFAFKQTTSFLLLDEQQRGESGGSLTRLEAADLNLAWDESWDKSGEKMFSLQENQDERGVKEEEAKIQPSLFPITPLDIDNIIDAYDKELVKFNEKMGEYEEEEILNSLDKSLPSHLNFS